MRACRRFKSFKSFKSFTEPERTINQSLEASPVKKIVLPVKRFVRSGEEICAAPKKRQNILYINGLSRMGEEICALPVEKIVRKGHIFSFQRLSKKFPPRQSLFR
jgi:hypothetical protein